MSSNPGQLVVTVVGTAVGAAFGNPQLGFLLGSTIGGVVFPAGQDTEGPRLNDTSVTTSTYGQSIPQVFGNYPVAGNILYAEDLREEETTTSQRGKGGGPKQTTYNYFATFYLGLCEVGDDDSVALLRMWFDGKLVYDITPEGASEDEVVSPFELRGTLIGTIANIRAQANDDIEQYFTFYTGAADQEPDVRMEEVLGAGNVPAYRGRSGIMFVDLPVDDYGRRIPNIEAELCRTIPPVQAFSPPTDENDGWEIT